MIKPIIANFLLMLFVSSQAGFILNHACLLQHRHHEKKSEKQNIFLTFTAAEWQSTEKLNEDEIRINGRMFDMKSVQFQKNKVIVYGHYDSKEDKMLAKAKEEKKKGDQKKQAHSDNTLFFTAADLGCAETFHAFQKKDYPFMNQAYYFQFLKIENPPPRYAV